MNLDELPILVVRDGVQRVISARGIPPRGMTPDGLVTGLRRSTRGWSEREFQSAIDAAIATEKYWPGIPAIVAARPPATRAVIETRESGPDTCPGCGVHRYYAGYRLHDGTVHPRLRCDCPQPGAGWDHPDALAWQEADAAQVTAGYGQRATAGAAP